MPDEKGKLSATKLKAIERELTKCGFLTKPCPACDKVANWTLEDRLIGLRLISIENKKINQLSSGLPAVVMHCDGCGYLMTFHAPTVGIE